MTTISPASIRVGLGQDAHRLVVGPPLMLGGVEIPSAKGLDGHSDADVLLHAVTDALLGAAGLGDIGEWFPNSDPQWKGAASDVFVLEAVKEIHARGWAIINLDCTISAEQPKLTPHKPAIRQRLAELLQLDVNCVNVKAKTGELVGPVGRGEAMNAEAIVLLVRIDNSTQTDS
ncbi:MAG: 2-C-methyl-D-erythritol 2,4-cyclodiphosphate synthase [Planctomycetaceae bacterium]|jgi:2-C-methyl-D-erythritol 2,4-cyclodiphosphate synthase|nr:2-C-methyl-D-erythritol 2,4-cyclodiphosphate synthase [Planctomycetaceae bacterium]